MTYVKQSVPKVGLNPGAGGDKNEKIVLVDADDILTWPSRDSKGVVINDNYVLKDNAYMIELYVKTSATKVNSSTEGEQDAEGFMHQLDVEHPGNSQEIREFKQNWLSRNIIAFVQHCSNSKKDVLGTKCAPLRMQIKWDDDKDKNTNAFTFKSALKSPYDIGDYRGTLTFDSVTGTVAANATTVDLANGEGRYQLTDGTSSAASITTCSNASDGLVFTLIGSGGSHPSTIAAGNAFELINGTTWTALSGSTITFKAFKNGASTYKYFELSRN